MTSESHSRREPPPSPGQPTLSVVIPLYRCLAFIPELYRRLTQTLEKMDLSHEIILVEDATGDASWEAVRRLAEADPRVRGFLLSRNFGQHFAITAGLDQAGGEWVVVMDGDLQDRPEEIPRLFAKAQEGYDVVLARRGRRLDSWPKRFGSRLFYRFFSFFTDHAMDPAVANFSLCRRQVIAHFRRFGEHSRLYPLFLHWMGFRRATVDVTHGERAEGRSSYTWKRLFNLALDNIIAHSNKPLKLFVKLGFLLASAALCFSLFLVGKYFLRGVPVQGWTSLMVTLWFFSGMLLVALGVLGLYIDKIFDEAKNRPLYIISERTGQSDSGEEEYRNP